MVNEDAAANELGYRALERAMKESQIHESTRSKVREFMKDPEIVELFTLVKGALEKSPHWSEVEYTFFETVADVAGDPVEEVKEKLKAGARFLLEERMPDGESGLCSLLGVRGPLVGDDPRSGKASS